MTDTWGEVIMPQFTRSFLKLVRPTCWEKWCQILRKNCETDWAQKYPQYVVSTWIGHDMEVSAKYYLQVPEQLYDEASRPNVPQTGTKTSTNPENNELARTKPSS